MTKYFNIVIVNMINLVNTFERKSNEEKIQFSLILYMPLQKFIEQEQNFPH